MTRSLSVLGTMASRPQRSCRVPAYARSAWRPTPTAVEWPRRSSSSTDSATRLRARCRSPPPPDAEVMSVNIGEAGEEPMVFYRDPIQLMTHLGEKHGADAIMGMAELIAWSQGPAKALGRFEVRTPPKTLDEMYACAATEAERT